MTRHPTFKKTSRLFGAAFMSAICLFGSQAWAQSAGRGDPEDPIRRQVNGGAIGLLSAALGGTYAQIAAELAIVLDQGDELRIMPMITKGSVQNIRDLLYMRGVDVALVQSDVLTYLDQQRIYANIKARIVYIAPLYTQEFHIVAGRNIQRFEDLAGKTVNFAEAGSGTAMTASILFEKYGVPVRAVNMSQPEALEKIKTGEIAATVWCAAKPIPGYAKIKAEDGFRFVSVPFKDAIAETYLPAELGSADYPNLIPAGSTVETIGMNAVLAAYNWPVNSERYRRVSLFVNAFFTKFQDFQKPPFHPKWREVNLAADLPGWSRMRIAQEWVDRIRGDQPAAQGAVGETGAMFEEFMRWRERQGVTVR